ncbi:MAG TPA: PilN domain-containing protein [Burkholderiales bacterium]
MKSIDLEYRPPAHRLGRSLFGAGLLLVVATAAAWMNLAGEAQRWDGVAVAASLHERTDVAAARDPAMLKEIDQANEVIHRLSLPWDALFRGMEDAASERIALLGVEPDLNRHMVTLSGEAQAYGEVLRYMTRLESGAVLTEPRLLSHEVRDEGPRHPVAFAISATWKISP